MFMGMGVSGGEVRHFTIVTLCSLPRLSACCSFSFQEGARNGPSLMPGGPREAYTLMEPIITKIAAQVLCAVAPPPCHTTTTCRCLSFSLLVDPFLSPRHLPRVTTGTCFHWCALDRLMTVLV